MIEQPQERKFRIVIEEIVGKGPVHPEDMPAMFLKDPVTAAKMLQAELQRLQSKHE